MSTAVAPVVCASRFRSSLESIIDGTVKRFGDMDREICKRMQPPAQVSSREILRNQEITDAQLIVKARLRTQR